jgi:hypothetical protein
MVGWIVDVYTLPQALMVMGVIVGVVGCIIIGAMMFPAKEFSNRKQSE